MSPSRRPRSSRSVRRTASLLLLFLAGAFAAVAPPDAAAREAAAREPAPADVSAVSPPAASVSAFAAEAATAEGSLLEAIWRFERQLRRRLTAAERGAPPAAGAGGTERLFRRLDDLRSAARRLEAGGGGELERKIRALRPLLLDLVRAESDARRSAPSPWRAEAGHAAPSLGAAEHASCATAPATGDGFWQATLGGGAGEPGELWLRYVAPSSGWLAVTTAGSDLDTVVEVFAACPAAGEAPLARGDDEVGLQARAAFRAAAGESRWIRIAGWRGATGSVVVELGGPTGITGSLTAEATGDPLTFQEVQLWDASGFFFGSVFTDNSGVYVFTPLTPGSYRVSSDVDFGSGVLDELYDDLPCPGGVFGGGCDPTTGTPIPVQSGELTSGIDLALGPGATVGGRVRAAATGEAIPFARVTVFSPAGAELSSVFTDAAGRYRVGGLASGVVFATADSDLFLRELYEDFPCQPSCDPTTGTPIPVTVDTTTAGIDFALDSLGAIAGRVTGTGAVPVAFENVLIFNAAGQLVAVGFTDSQGDYEEGGIAPGQYFVASDTFGTFLDELYDDLPCFPSCDPTLGTPVPVSSGAVTPGIDFELQRLGRVRGRVVDAVTLEGLAATIRVFDASGSFASIVSSGSTGFYEIPGLIGGTYFVTAAEFPFLGELYDDLPCPGGLPSGCDPTTGTPVSVQIDAVTEGIDFALDRLGVIAGTLTEAGTGVPLDFGSVQAWNASGELVTNAFSDGLGRYQLVGLPAGSHYVTALTQEHVGELYDDLPCADLTCDPTTGTAIPVALGTTVDGIDLALTPKGRVVGTVSEAGTGLPVVSGNVQVWDSAGEFVADGFLDGVGAYRVGGLDTGSYFVTLTSPTHAGQLYDGLPCPGGVSGGGCDPTAGTPVAAVVGAPTTGIDFSTPRLGSLSGRVTDAETGAPLQDADVWLLDATGQVHDVLFFLGPDGRYRFENVPTGDWFVVVLALPLYADELYDDLSCPDLTCDPTTGTPVAVANGAETAGIDFALDPASGIVGRLTSDLGDPVVGAAIDLWNPAGELVASTASGATGFYRLLPDAGAYFVSTDNGQGLIDELYDDVACPLGPAFEGLCDPLGGDPVVLPSFDSLVDGVDFQLTPSLSIFSDGFESGDISAWSASVP